jgi:polysaccharide export outer membrane protein
MRAAAGSSERTEIPVDIKLLMSGKGQDVPLKAEDILFIPTSAKKAAAVRGLESALQIGTGIAIYRR